MKTNIFQMYYDDASKAIVDPGFLPLHNAGNPRPDWYEYWPMRHYLLENTLNEDDLYGFLSPSFYSKTHLKAEGVYAFIDANPGHDVYTFSPYKQESMCYLNIFEHGNRYHPGMVDVIDKFLRSIGIEVDFTNLVMDLRTTLFCNYFAAKPVFWEKWFAITEKMFEICEGPDSELSRLITGKTVYRPNSPHVDMKVFIIERIASLILALDPDLKIANFDIGKMPWSDVTYYPYRDELMTVNALKMAYAQTGDKNYLRNFLRLRNSIFVKCDRLFAVDSPIHFF